MKVIKCDRCNGDFAKSYKYSMELSSNSNYIDLCPNCFQDFILEKRVKLYEVMEDNKLNEVNSKKLILG